MHISRLLVRKIGGSNPGSVKSNTVYLVHMSNLCDVVIFLNYDIKNLIVT